MSFKKKFSWVALLEVIVILFLVLIIGVMVVCNLLFKNGAAAPLFGMYFFKTTAITMEPEIPVNTVIIAKKSEIPNIRERSVILCKIGDYTALIRVVRVDEEVGELFYVVKFDTSRADETFRIKSEDVIAKAVYQLEAFGKFLDFATSPTGIILSVILPLFFIITFQVIKIVNIRKLESAAASLEDIDELILSRDEAEEPAPVKFTEPKFVEDITDKFNRVNPAEPPPFKERAPEPVLSVNARGRAEYVAPPRKTAPAEPEAPLFTYDRLPKKTVAAETGTVEIRRDELYLNKPTRIEPAPPKSKLDEFLDTYSPAKSAKNAASEEKIVFTPHLSNVIPAQILDVQAEASAPVQTTFDESIKAYYAKDDISEKRVYSFAEETAYFPLEEPQDVSQPQEEQPSAASVSPLPPLPPPIPTIPKMAVIPKETLTPPKKKKTSKTLDELLSIIDAEESKLKK